MGFASGAQQLPNNLEQKNYNNTDEERARAFRGSGAVSFENKQTNKQTGEKQQAETKQRSDGGAAISPLWRMCGSAAFGLLQVTLQRCNGINNGRFCHHATLHTITPGVIFCTPEPWNHLLLSSRLFERLLPHIGKKFPLGILRD